MLTNSEFDFKSYSQKHYIFNATILVSLVPYKSFAWRCRLSCPHTVICIRKALVTSKGPRNDSTKEDEEMVIDFFWPLHGGVWLLGTKFPLQKGLSRAEIGFAIMLRFAVIP